MNLKFGNFELSINSSGQAAVDVRNELLRISEDYGEAFSFFNATYDYTAADTITLVKNSHASKNMYIDRFILHGDTETEVKIHVPTATFTPAGTTITGQALNRVLDKSVTNYAVAYGDETGNTQGDIIYSIWLKADTRTVIDITGAIIIKPEDSIGIDFVTEGAEAHAGVIAYWK